MESETVNLSGEVPALGGGYPIGVVPIVFGIGEINHDTIGFKVFPNLSDVPPIFIPKNSGGERMDDFINRVSRSGLALVEFHHE